MSNMNTLPPPLTPFRAQARFTMPMLGNLQGEVWYASADHWLCCTTPTMLATGMAFGSFEKPDLPVPTPGASDERPSGLRGGDEQSEDEDESSDELQQREVMFHEILQHASALFSVGETERVYMSLDEKNGEGLQVWTDQGIVVEQGEHIDSLTAPFSSSAFLFRQALAKWESLEPTEAEPPKGWTGRAAAESNEPESQGWKVKVEEGFVASFYFLSTQQEQEQQSLSNLKLLVLQGPPEYGLLAVLPIMFQNVESDDEGYGDENVLEMVQSKFLAKKKALSQLEEPKIKLT